MKLKNVLIALSVLMSSTVVLAQSNCVRVDQIAKWEVLDPIRHACSSQYIKKVCITVCFN